MADRFLTDEDIAAIARVWGETGSFKATAEKLGFHRETVRKYVDEGEPARGIKPLREQVVARVNEKLQPTGLRPKTAAQVDHLAEADVITLSAIKRYKAIVVKRLQDDLAALAANPNDEKALARIQRFVKLSDFATLVTLERTILGAQPTVGVNVSGTVQHEHGPAQGMKHTDPVIDEIAKALEATGVVVGTVRMPPPDSDN